MLDRVAKWGFIAAFIVIAAGSILNSLAVVIVGSAVLIVAGFCGTLATLKAIDRGEMSQTFDLFPRRRKDVP